MRTILIFLTLTFIVFSCKNTKNETDVPVIDEQKIIDPIYTDIDSNIGLTDTIKIESFSYRKLENEENNLEIKFTFSKESFEILKTYKDINLYVLLYPLREDEIKLLPTERVENKFDNWSVYELQKLSSNTALLKVNTKIFDFAKVEMGLFELKTGNRFGNMYVINNAYFQ